MQISRFPISTLAIQNGVSVARLLRELKQVVESHCGEGFNSCLGNFYNSGEEGMSWHSDAEKTLLRMGQSGR
ncbi:hypothetical protein HSBAA_42560 [Vreelandella sulfidaeris]|uniref:Alpha-ketoglutarate-dependent dioxygenase AlkB-like domain-containing protein n=1 Tax=Vreelandella sulfidaeris TaxID=115553 RepID=A0A455U9T6_9GAMM|nr:hypothetical protein HSBAA_42560 [Halomonas sulfidaeris]